MFILAFLIAALTAIVLFAVWPTKVILTEEETNDSDEEYSVTNICAHCGKEFADDHADSTCMDCAANNVRRAQEFYASHNMPYSE
jgi:hypothetical protein